MALVQDSIKDAAVSLDKDGWKATRVFIVSDLTGDPHARLYEAATAVGVPQRGESHPSIPFLQLDTKQATLSETSTNVAYVTLNYRVFDVPEQDPGEAPPQIQTGGTVQEVQTSFDASGDQIVVNLTDAEGNPLPAQTGTVTVSVPQAVLRLSRKEIGDPEDKALAFMGTINGGDFRGKAPHTWLCKTIEGSSDDGGLTYTVNYEFIYNPSGWDADIVYIDPDTGNPHEDIDRGTGNGVLENVQVYPESDFSALALEVG